MRVWPLLKDYPSAVRQTRPKQASAHPNRPHDASTATPGDAIDVRHLPSEATVVSVFAPRTARSESCICHATPTSNGLV
jgi:hypothetical protein